jgi:thioesterase domain-containing protein
MANAASSAAMQMRHWRSPEEMHGTRPLRPNLLVIDTMNAAGPAIETAPDQEAEWTQAFRSAGNLPPLFCICAGGGDAFDYRDLALALPENQPVYAFGLPSRDAREAFPTVQGLAATFIDEMRRRQPFGSYRLCGHSFGAVVAYEMARLLAHAGKKVDFVAMIDAENPSFKQNMSYKEKIIFRMHYIVDRIAKYTRNLARGSFGQIARDAVKFVHRRCRRAVWKLARAVFGRMGRPAPNPIQSNDMLLVSAWHRYDPGQYAGRVVLLNSVDRPPEYRRDPTTGWARCATGPIDVHVVPGDHLSIMHPPHVQVLAEAILPYLSLPRGDAP